MSKRVFIEFYFDVLSPYAWIGFEALARYQPVWDVDVRWRPFFMGGLFKDTGNKGIMLQAAAKKQFFFTDLAHLAKYYGIPLIQPKDADEAMIKHGSLRAQRFLTLLDAQHRPLVKPAAREFWLRRYSRDQDIHLNENIIEVARTVGLSNKITENIMEQLDHNDTKKQLLSATEEARASGAFGAPWINVHTPDGQVHSFWGSDRFHIIAHLIGQPFPGPLRNSAQ
uniref:Glutathione S-transferase kappa n=1 Tax=Plectus sambesii TaxID=2011161 RepID=A0A914X3R4_9BILA